MVMFRVPIDGIHLGILQTLWLISGPLYILGRLLFGIATFRTRVLSRWADLLLAVGAAITPAAAVFPFAYRLRSRSPLASHWCGWATRCGQSAARTFGGIAARGRA